MMDSEAWEQLDCYSATLYVHMKKKYNKSNEQDISFTYKEGMKLMSKPKFTQAIDQLIECGFIELVEQNWNTRKCNIYGFSDKWQLYGTDKFKINKRKKRLPSKTRGSP